MDTKIKIAIAAVALAGVAALAWNVSQRPEPARASAMLAKTSGVDLESPTAETGALAATPPTSSRETLPAAEPKKHPLPSAHPPIGGTVLDVVARGRVVDVEGNAVAGLPLVIVPRGVRTPLADFRAAEESKGEPAATSAGDGSFEVKTTHFGGTLVASGDQWTTVFATDVGMQSRPQADLLVVVAPRGGLGGDVVTEDGAPVAGAKVEVHVERRILSNLAGVADQSFEIPWRATTDERGRFEIAAAPAIEGASLVTSFAGYANDFTQAPPRPSLDLRIVLHRIDKTFPRGEVVDARGRPVEGALVSCNLSSTRTDAEGRFTIDVDREYFEGLFSAPKDEIVAVQRGFLPARFAKPKEGWPAFVTLRLDGEPLEIRGRVVDETGAAVAGAEVWSVDEHGFGVVLEDVGNTGRFQSVEALLRGGEEFVTTTDEDGAFAVGGLLADRYRVACFDRRSLRHSESGPIAAGERDVRLVLGGAARCARVAGRIVSRAGKPVGGVLVHPGVRVPRWPYVEDPRFATHGEAVTTDAEGRFAFEKLFPEGLSFQLLSPQLTVIEWTPPADAKLDALEIAVALRCHVQVDLGDRRDTADSFVVLDAAGAKIEALEYQGPIASVQDPVPIELGKSPVVAITEDARTLVLSKKGEEVARFPLSIAPGELKVVHP